MPSSASSSSSSTSSSSTARVLMRFTTTPPNGRRRSRRRRWKKMASSIASRRGDVTRRKVVRRSASSSLVRAARSRKPSAMSPKLAKNSDRSWSRSTPVTFCNAEKSIPVPRPNTFRPSLPGRRNSCSDRESTKRERRSGASRKSSALRDGGVSSTSRS